MRTSNVRRERSTKTPNAAMAPRSATIEELETRQAIEGRDQAQPHIAALVKTVRELNNSLVEIEAQCTAAYDKFFEQLGEGSEEQAARTLIEPR